MLLLAGPCAARACQPARAPAYCLLPQRVLQPCVAEFRRRSGPGRAACGDRGAGSRQQGQYIDAHGASVDLKPHAADSRRIAPPENAASLDA